MSIVDRAAAQSGIELERDVPKPGNRRCRDWAKVIGTMRKLESQEATDREELHSQIHDCEKRNRELLEEVFGLREKVKNFNLADRMRQIELPDSDRKLLLEAPVLEVPVNS